MTIRSINGGALSVFALVVAAFVDHPAAQFLHATMPVMANRFFAFLCSWPYYVILFFAPLLWTQGKRKTTYPQVITAIILAYLSTVLLKQIFQVPRPFVLFGWTPLESFRDYGFPSSHAATVFALLPLARAYAPRLQVALWWAFALTVAFARVSLGMHFVSDVISGAMVGWLLGYTVVHWRKAWSVLAGKSGSIETLRQTIHVLFGLLIIILVRTSLITSMILPIIAVLGACLALLQKRYGLSSLARIIGHLERPSDRSLFPGRGIFFYLLGSWIALLLFPIDIASASILILAFGDGASSLVGQCLGRTKIAYNPHKSWEGTLGGMVAASIAAGYFLPWWTALVASIITMLVETFPLRLGRIRLDDNLILPFVAGSTITLVSSLIR